jgi:hypothetical protein
MARPRSARTVDEFIRDDRNRPGKGVRAVWLVWSGIGVALLCVILILAVVFWPRGSDKGVPLTEEQKKQFDELRLKMGKSKTKDK